MTERSFGRTIAQRGRRLLEATAGWLIVAGIVEAAPRQDAQTNGVAGGTNTTTAATATNSVSSTNAVTATNSVTATNVVQHFALLGYNVEGNTLIPEDVLDGILSKYTGTNVTIGDVVNAQKEVQLEYHNRGYDTVLTVIPRGQVLTNGILRMDVVEGTLSEILVTGNRFYSSNNVMRALPGLTTNMILNSKVFQAEMDRANANQDRQIYPQIAPGAEPGTSSLVLKVKDRFPLHGQTELNNQSTPGTPELRINTSGVYNNLWQLDHSFGAQYSFTPESAKGGDQWNFYDSPLVANYSAFYRAPLGSPESVSEAIEARPGSFGYSEATRRFELPAATGRPEFNLFASRSTIDTGVIQPEPPQIEQQNVGGSVMRVSDHQDLTVNQDIGFRFSAPLREFNGIRSTFTAGLDYKTYQIQSFDTNRILITQFLVDTSGNPFTRVSTVFSPQAPTWHSLAYIPLSLKWDANRQDRWGTTTLGLSYSPNLWFSDGKPNVQAVAGSAHASGYWHILGGSITRDQVLYKDWRLTVRADGQWASEPLISNEQFGVGGVGGVRGYREGEVFGSSGWRITSELKTPAHLVGYITDGTSWPLTLRASIFMDYAMEYTLDGLPGERARTPLWGTGAGVVASASTHYEARLMFAFPLRDTPTSEAGQLRIAFALNAQF